MRTCVFMSAVLLCFCGSLTVPAANAKGTAPKAPEHVLNVPPKQCAAHLAAYRDAIQFVEGRMEHSPAAITYVAQNGDSITVENRVYRTLERNRQLLVSGFVTKARRCRDQQSG